MFVYLYTAHCTLRNSTSFFLETSSNEMCSMEKQTLPPMSYFCQEQIKYAVFAKNKRFVPHIDVFLILQEGFMDKKSV